MCMTGTSQLFALGAEQGGEGGGQGPTTSPAISFQFHIFCSEQDAPIVLNHVKKKPTEAFVLRNLSSKERAETEQFNSLRTFVS